jgi:hypothetical protein
MDAKVRCSWCSLDAVCEAWILHWNEWVPTCADHRAFHVSRPLPRKDQVSS